MFGASWHGLMGTSHFALEQIAGPWLLAFFLYQLVFCGTATTIISGAVAERFRFSGYLVVSFVVSAFFYPLFGHWAWGGAAEGAPAGWLAKAGFVDFAGSTVVHSLGGWISLAAVLVVGPRLGRFDADKPAMHGSDLPMATLGVFLLWFGWFGFNGGSTLAVNDTIPLILVNTNLAAATGGAAALALAWCVLGRPDVTLVMNGVLGGLVAITAGCNLVSPGGAIVIGAAGGAVSVLGTWLLEKCKIDDVVGAVPVHAFAGVWGTLAVVLFADPAIWTHGGGRWAQFWIQFQGVAVCFAFAFGGGYVVLWLVNRVFPLRVSKSAELLGLNVSEHAAKSDMFDLLYEMEQQRAGSNFAQHVTVEPHTEVGQFARQYNRVLDKVHAEITSREQAVEALRQAEAKYRGIFEKAVEGIFQTTIDGHYLSANPALARIYGYTSPEELAAAVRDIQRQLYVDAQRRSEFQRLIDRDGSVTAFESEIFRRDGSTIWISENAQPGARLGRPPVVLRRHGHRHHRSRAKRQLAPRKGSRRGRLPGQEPVSGQHEPRNSHAAQWSHRHARSTGGHRAHAEAAPLCADRQVVGRFAVEPHQPDPRFLQDRGRQAGARLHRFRFARSSRIPPRCLSAAPSKRTWSWPVRSVPTCPRPWWAIPTASARSSSI